MNNILSCPPFGDLPVEWDGEALDDAAALALNVKLVEKLWPQSWPSIHAAVIEVVREYEHEEHFEPASKSLAICVSDLNADPEAQWSVVVRTEPFAGVYEVEMQGSKVSDAGATF
jgi:hypothetical protein